MTFLETIASHRRARIAEEYGALSPADRERLACCSRPPRDFRDVLVRRPDVAVIAEVKKASPSAGLIAPDCEASKQALHYQDGGAAAISVLTEPEFFRGSFTDLSDVADAVDIPVLCKDFVLDPVQHFVARGHGADAILLIVRLLGSLTSEHVDVAATLGLTPVVEVADYDELRIALGSGATVIAVNARDLRTFEVDREASLELVEAAAGSEAAVIAASGIRDRADVARAAEAGADAVLVGESLMRAQFPEDVLAELTGVARRASSA